MSSNHRAPRRRTTPRTGRTTLVWASCVVAALLLTLGVSGTLSAWTSAIITNSSNTVATTSAVILQEVGPDGTAGHTPQTCQSSTGAANSYSCTTINKYGGTTTPLAPGGNQVTDVTFTNLGSANASSFVLTTGACSQSPAAGSGTPGAANLCTSGDLTVAISCSPGTTYTAGSAWADLTYPAGAPGSIPATLTRAAGLASNATATCRFTPALLSTASVLAQGITVSQTFTWTLNK